MVTVLVHISSGDLLNSSSTSFNMYLHLQITFTTKQISLSKHGRPVAKKHEGQIYI